MLAQATPLCLSTLTLHDLTKSLCRQEPLEEVVCEVEDQYTGPLIEAMSSRKVRLALILLRCSCTSQSHLPAWCGAGACHIHCHAGAP